MISEAEAGDLSSGSTACLLEHHDPVCQALASDIRVASCTVSTTAWCYKEQNEKCGRFIDAPALWIRLGYSWFCLDGVILKFVLAMKLPFAISHVPKGFPSGSVVKNLPANAGSPAGDAVQSLGREDPLEEETATHSSSLAWKIPRTKEPGRLHRPQSTGS